MKQLQLILFRHPKHNMNSIHIITNQLCLDRAKGLSYDLDKKLEYVIDMVETYGYASIFSDKMV